MKLRNVVVSVLVLACVLGLCQLSSAQMGPPMGPPTQAQVDAETAYSSAVTSQTAANSVLAVTVMQTTGVYNLGPRPGLTLAQRNTRTADYEQLVNPLDGSGLCQIQDNLTSSAAQDLLNASGLYATGMGMVYFGYSGDQYFALSKTSSDTAKGKYETLYTIRNYILPIYSEMVALSGGN